MTKLLAVVEVEKEKKVRCCAPNCNKSVYKRIHIVEDNNEIIVLGETCYKIIYRNELSKKSLYTVNQSKILTDDERVLLIQNTKELIHEFEKNYQMQQEILKEKERKNRESRLLNISPPLELNLEQKNKFHKNAVNQKKSYSGNINPNEVICAFCGNKMISKTSFIPAKGYKCESCKKKNAQTSLYSQQLKKRT